MKVGDNLDLLSTDPTLHKIAIGAGWDMSNFNADNMDLDLSLIMLDRNDMTRTNEDFTFYNNTEAFEGAVKHHGDSRTGAGDGDDEFISVDLRAISFDIVKILIIVTIYKGFEKRQNLDMVKNAYVRIVNEDNNYEICRVKLDETIKDKEDTGIIAAVLEREGPKWNFIPLDETIPGGLAEIARKHGMIINQE